MRRNAGTLSGDIATASPAADTLPVLYALDAGAMVASTRRERTVPIPRCRTPRAALASGVIIMVTEGDAGRNLSAEIGVRVRQSRVKAGLSGVKLARAAGVSQPFLSQLESGQSSVAIATLYRIAQALGVQPSDLLPTAAPAEIEVVRSAETRRIPLSEDIHTANARAIFRSGRKISELYDYEISAEDYIEDWFSSDSEHALYVLEGTLRIEFEGRPEIVLAAGDAIFYKSQVPHRWHSGQGARIILVVADP